MANITDITFPAFELTGAGSIREIDYLGLCLRLPNYAPSQYGDYNFDSMCMFQGRPIAAGPNGIFTLDTAETDNGILIYSLIESRTTDFGTSRQSRLRAAYVGYETSGSLKLIIVNDDENERIYTLSPIKASQLQHGNKVSIGRDGKGRYWIFKIENVDGCDFSLDFLEVIPIVMGRRPEGL